MYREFTLKTENGLNLFSKSFINTETPKGIVIIIHGKGEHSGRYHEIAEYMAARNLAVYTMDLRGHGKSGGKVGHTSPRSKILSDINLLIDTAQKEHKNIPLFIFGHSMGGNIALDYRMTNQKNANAYIISAPWLYLYEPQPKAIDIMVPILANILPKMTIKTAINPESISSIKEERGENDPLSNSVISLSTYRDVLISSKKILKTASNTKSPMLLLHGTDDSLVSIKGSRELYEKSKDVCEYHEFKGSRHEMHHDIEKQRFFELVCDYIEKFI